MVYWGSNASRLTATETLNGRRFEIRLLARLNPPFIQSSATGVRCPAAAIWKTRRVFGGVGLCSLAVAPGPNQPIAAAWRVRTGHVSRHYRRRIVAGGRLQQRLQQDSQRL